MPTGLALVVRRVRAVGLPCQPSFLSFPVVIGDSNTQSNEQGYEQATEKYFRHCLPYHLFLALCRLRGAEVDRADADPGHAPLRMLVNERLSVVHIQRVVNR
jgi:hypothetical protein